MIFIAVKFTARPEYADSWLEHTADFTRATRAEEGNLFFDWSRSVEDPNQYVLLEGFRDGDAGAAHVGSDHFKAKPGDDGRSDRLRAGDHQYGDPGRQLGPYG